MDFFYKGLRYETVAMREAFPFISLLSEVGGFMGLLLGASCLTIVEVIDYCVLLMVKRSDQRKTTPVEPIEEELEYVSVE